MLIKVGTLIIPIDLVLFDYENENNDTTIYLGRPFMIMTSAVIDITRRRVSMFVSGFKDDVELAIGKARIKKGRLIEEGFYRKVDEGPPMEFRDALAKIKESGRDYFYSHEVKFQFPYLKIGREVTYKIYVDHWMMARSE